MFCLLPGGSRDRWPFTFTRRGKYLLWDGKQKSSVVHGQIILDFNTMWTPSKALSESGLLWNFTDETSLLKKKVLYFEQAPILMTRVKGLVSFMPLLLSFTPGSDRAGHFSLVHNVRIFSKSVHFSWCSGRESLYFCILYFTTYPDFGNLPGLAFLLFLKHYSTKQQ